MEFRDVARRRRMVRRYAPDPVPRDAIERIVDAAQHAPSAGFSQGQRLVVVTDPERRRRIAEIADEPHYVEAGFDPWLSQAPLHVVPCVSEEVYHRRYREPDKIRADGTEIDWPVPFWWVDVGATLQLILLAAVDEGLAAGFCGVWDLPALKRELHIPAEYTPIGIVTIGRPLEDRRSGSLARGWASREEFARRETWIDGARRPDVPS
jgi:nitroreductase